MQLNELDVISWDVDGTLYSSPQMIKKLLSLSFTRLASSNPLKIYRDLVMLHQVRRNMRQIRANNGDVSSSKFGYKLENRLQIEEYWYGEAIKHTALHTGVKAVIDLFSAAGLRQIIVSDYESSYKLRILGLDNVFEAFYAGETIGFVKPSPKLFTHVAMDLGIKPQRILHIGDHENRDGEAARNAGCQVAILGQDFGTFHDLLSTIEDM